MKNMSSTDNIRTIALTNILAAQKVIKYNQQFLRSEDIADVEKSDEETVLLRLTILKNFLSKSDKQISVEEFSFMHHELFTV